MKKNYSDLLKRKEILDFIRNNDSMISFNYDDCPMYIFKEEIGVEFYLQYKEERDYSEVKEFVLFARPVLSKMLEEVRNKELLSKI